MANKKRRKPHTRTSTLFTRYNRIYAKWISQDNEVCFYIFRNQSEEVIARHLRMIKAKDIIYTSHIKQVNPNQTLSNSEISSLLNFDAREVVYG